MKKISWVLIIVLCLSLLGCSSAAEGETPAEEEGPKIGLLVQGNANDAGWNQSAVDGVNKIAEQFGGEVSISENVAISDIEEAFMNYAQNGFKIVVGHGYSFADPAMKVAADYLDTVFVITSSNAMQEPNVLSINNNNKEQGYLSGVAAGYYTESGKIGVIGGMKIPSIESWVEGVLEGVAKVNPDAECLVSYTGNFEDSVAAKELTLAMIDEGADLVMGNLDPATAGVISACQDKGIATIAPIIDKYDMAPDVILTSGISDLSMSIALVGEKVLMGDFEAKAYTMGVAEGVIDLAPFRGDWENALDEEEKAKILSIIKELTEEPLQ